MSVAYVDTSYVIPIAFSQPGAAAMARRLGDFEDLVASDLLQAELRSVCARENVPPPDDILSAITWILPKQALHAEVRRVLTAGYVRSADAYHLAAALRFAVRLPDVASLTFLTLDTRQRSVAEILGFKTH